MDNLASKYGLHGLTLAPAGAPGSGAHNGAMTGQRYGRLDPDNPMLWLLGIGAATLGLIAASTSLRVGPVRASASVGKQ